MKALYKIAILILVLHQITYAQIGINATGAAPDAKAMLDISSTNKGFLWPRMTLAQRNAISSAPGVTPEGLTVFDTDTKNLWIWKNAAWQAYLPSPWDINGEHIFNMNDGSVGIGGAPDANYKLDIKGIMRAGNLTSSKIMVYNPLTVNDLHFNGGDAYISSFDEGSNMILQKWSDTKLAVGEITPTQKLDIDGQIRIRGGSPGTGKVLTSAADGTGSWQTPTVTPHNHFGETWSGSTTNTGLEIINNNTVNNIAAIIGKMAGSGTAQNSGVLGETSSLLGRGVLGINLSGTSYGLPGINAGVSGVAGTGKGVHGNSVSGASIHGEKTSSSGQGNAGLFTNLYYTSPEPTVLISNSDNNQTALELKNGYLKVSGATNKTAFIITAGTGTTITGNRVRFSYPGMSNSDILIVNHQYVGAYIGAVGNWYDGSQWTIFREDNLPMPAGEKFTVLVIKQ